MTGLREMRGIIKQEIVYIKEKSSWHSVQCLRTIIKIKTAKEKLTMKKNKDSESDQN